MVEFHPEILYFGPSDSSRSPLADYAYNYIAALQQDKSLTIVSVLDNKTAEELDGKSEGVSGVIKQTNLALIDRAELPDQVIHAEISRMTKREFWGAQYVARKRKDCPLVLVFHKPPDLPEAVKPPPRQQNPRFFERFLFNFSAWLSNIGQRHLRRIFLNRAAVLLGPSRRAAEILAQRYPEYRNKIGIIRPMRIGPLPPEDLAPHPRDEEGQKVRITFIGSIRPGRGVEELLNALAFLDNRKREYLSGIHVRIRGKITREMVENGFLEAIRERIKTLRLAYCVDFQPGVMTEYQMNELLIDSDIFVLPYLPGACDGTSFVLLRAQAWALAVVASDVGAVGEMIRNGEDGLLYPSGDSMALADRLEKLLDDPELRVRLATNLREKALKLYAPEKVALQLRELYEEVLLAHNEKRPVRMPRHMLIEEAGKTISAILQEEEPVLDALRAAVEPSASPEETGEPQVVKDPVEQGFGNENQSEPFVKPDLENAPVKEGEHV